MDDASAQSSNPNLKDGPARRVSPSGASGSSGDQSKQIHDTLDPELDQLIKDAFEEAQNIDLDIGDIEHGKKDRSQMVDELKAELEFILHDYNFPEYETGHRKGRLHLPSYLQSKWRKEASGHWDNRIFQKAQDPKRKAVSVVGILDRSGSMQGEKLAYSKEALAVIAEAFQEMNLPIGLLAFDNQVEVIKELEHDLYAEEWYQNLSEVEARGTTDDTLALQHAVKMLEDSDAITNIIVFITDGIGNHRQEEEVKRIQEEYGYWVVGLGLGNDCTSVETTYPRGKVVENIEDLPEVLSKEIAVLTEEGLA